MLLVCVVVVLLLMLLLLFVVGVSTEEALVILSPSPPLLIMATLPPPPFASSSLTRPTFLHNPHKASFTNTTLTMVHTELQFSSMSEIIIASAAVPPPRVPSYNFSNASLSTPKLAKPINAAQLNTPSGSNRLAPAG